MNKGDNTSQGTSGVMMCDRCGKVEQMQVRNQPENMSVEEAKTFVRDMHYAAKHWYAQQGWSTSAGRDLCPDCCKAEGKAPGYKETGVVPDITVVPRKKSE